MDVKEVVIPTEVIICVEEKEVQTKKEDKCICKKKIPSNNVHIEEDKVVCILTRAQCTYEEWKKYEDKVESEMDLEDLLDYLGKVLEAAKMKYEVA